MWDTKIVSTCFSDIELCKPGDFYKPIGKYIDNKEILQIFDAFFQQKLLQSFNCIEKAEIAAHILSNSERGPLSFIIGSLFVISTETNSHYGYLYRPPLEMHAWIYSKKQDVIYDMALAGTIIAGLNASDEKGPFLKNIDPVIIAEVSDKIPQYIRYQAYEEYRA
jgi:hypothetical protein